MKTKFKYNQQIHHIIGSLKARKGYHVDTRVLDYCGNICAACSRDLKVYFGIVQNVASIGIFTPTDTNFLIPYSICRHCAEEAHKTGEYSVKQLNAIQAFIEDHIPEVKILQE